MHKITPSSKIANLRNSIKLPWLIVTLLVFGGLIKLGVWQLNRADEKIQRLAHIEQLKKHDALSIQQIIDISQQNTKNQAESINDLPVEITASFDSEHVFLLDNQANKNALGYRVFQIAKTPQHNFLVNLGWIAGSVNRQILPLFKAVSGMHTFKGNIRKMERGVVLQEQTFEQITWPLRVQQIETEKLSPLIGEKLLPFVVYLDKKEQLGFAKNWHPVVMPPEKHQAYAFQWFSLAIAWLLLMIWASYKNSTTYKNNKGHENEQ